MRRGEVIGALMVGVVLASLVAACNESGVGLAFWSLRDASDLTREAFGKSFILNFMLLNLFFVVGPLLVAQLFRASTD
ncbi:hypothetical protein BLA39750_01304 [Burkholderia lata]|uniref:Uncharacterized protein n=1 Tax=Burkholderia lata (strain ATCC 17760 / DSM 23089 / LMG 22485 / NCIMB 9086 / R18194 / 383) TaxID=482957 RepID=A0A6P2V313_BURL3|nr:hypothetical protein BLA39750_01304 [Burkholderia lata]